MLSLAEIISSDLSKLRFNKQILHLSCNIKYPDIANNYMIEYSIYNLNTFYISLCVCTHCIKIVLKASDILKNVY